MTREMRPADRRQLRSELHAQDVAWRMGYKAGLGEARQRRRWRFWRLWAAVTLVALVGALAWPYRYWIAAGVALAAWGLVVWFWWVKDRLQRGFGQRWVSDGITHSGV
jgi:hypothetical protein